MSIKNKLLAIFLILILASCYKEPFEELLEQEPRIKSIKKYNSFLASEYTDYAKYLHQIKDTESTNHFSQKALDAFSGAYLSPEIPQNWSFPPNKMDEAIFAGKRLMAVNNFNTKINLPVQLSHLILLYDCWISGKGHKIGQFIPNSSCKNRFYLLLDEIEEYETITKTKKEKEVELDLTEFTLYFDSNSYKLNSGATKELKNTLEFLNNYDDTYSILLVGSTDSSGKKLYNKYLSTQRVKMVKNRLFQNGVPKNVVYIKSFGENKPNMITDNKAQTKNNRYVKIYISRTNNISKIPLPIIEQNSYFNKITRAKKTTN
ncbi:MAG: outer membrane protein OmpA-like peptidoglycan-associated protein [Rickettsiales bacterium]